VVRSLLTTQPCRQKQRPIKKLKSLATALAVFLARKGYSKEKIREQIKDHFGYDLDRTVDNIRPFYSFDVSCRETLPEAIIVFLYSDSYEDAVRNAVSLGGESNTFTCITVGAPLPLSEMFFANLIVHAPFQSKSNHDPFFKSQPSDLL